MQTTLTAFEYVVGRAGSHGLNNAAKDVDVVAVLAGSAGKLLNRIRHHPAIGQAGN